MHLSSKEVLGPSQYSVLLSHARDSLLSCTWERGQERRPAVVSGCLLRACWWKAAAVINLESQSDLRNHLVQLPSTRNLSRDILNFRSRKAWKPQTRLADSCHGILWLFVANRNRIHKLELVPDQSPYRVRGQSQFCLSPTSLGGLSSHGLPSTIASPLLLVFSPSSSVLSTKGSLITPGAETAGSPPTNAPPSFSGELFLQSSACWWLWGRVSWAFLSSHLPPAT